MKSNLKVHLTLFPYYLSYVVLIILVKNNSFFWDKDVMISKQAFWFIENNFNFQLPISIDTGYFPALSLVLAFLWKIVGIHLSVGHLLMLPFALWLIFEYYKFISFFSENKVYIHFTLILLVIDTTLLSQVIVVSTDLLLVLFFFTSLNGILYRKRRILYFSLLALSLTHFRGLMSCFIVFLFDLLVLYRKNNSKFDLKNILKIIPPYIPFTLLIVAYYIFHYKTAGWNFNHDRSPWAGCFEVVGWKGLFFNSAILIWRLIDFGRLFFWVVLGYYLFQFIKSKLSMDSNLSLVLILLFFCALIYFPPMVIYKILGDHRYIIPFFNLITIFVGYLAFVKSGSGKQAKWIFALLLAGLITGNLWIYPDKIAKGWASTAAHIPFYQLRVNMIDYIEEEGITFTDVGTDIPNNAPLKYIFLNGDERYFPMKDLKNQQYIFYSNIFNNFTDEEIDELKLHWVLEKEFRCIQVKVQLYRKSEGEGKR